MAKGPYEVLDLKALRCFFSMATHASLTKAGIELRISEAAVSQRVKGLERDLGVKLYEARGGRVRLTPAGERTVSLAVAVFDEIKAFEHALGGSEESGEIVLSSHDTVLGYLLPDVVERFTRAHPLARLRLLARPVEDTLRLLRANDADLGVIAERDLPRELEFGPIVAYPACLLTPRGHALARRAKIDFTSLINEETIQRYPLIVAEVQLEGRVLKETFARLKLPLNIGLQVGTIETLKRYVARGLGVAVVSTLCVTEEDRARLEVIPVPEKFGGETRYGVVLRRDKHRGPLLNSLLQLLHEIGQR
jgi:DNA-binding transcriptional LysR family regulator